MTENLLFAAMQNIKVHGTLHPMQLAMLLNTDIPATVGLLHTLMRRMLITRNRNGSYSPRPKDDGLKHPRTFATIEGKSR